MRIVCPGVAHFNDALREAIKGSDFDSGNDTGFVTGKPFMEGWIATGISGRSVLSR